ncbi:hypothetical protein JOM56_001072 [Amanita muscaria]
MHRRALLDMIQKWTSPSLLEQGLPTWFTNEVTVHKVVDPADGSVRLGTQSESSTMLHPGSSPQIRSSSAFASSSRTFPTSHISANSGSSSLSSESSMASSTSRYNFFPVQWADWGPPISQWWQVSETQRQLTGTSAGQRYAFSVPNPRDKGKYKIGVVDFNIHNEEKPDEGKGGNGGKKEENDEELETLDHKGVFSEDVFMGLKCVVYHALGEYDIDGVLMDEERLLGWKIDSEDIKVLYFG